MYIINITNQKHDIMVLIMNKVEILLNTMADEKFVLFRFEQNVIKGTKFSNEPKELYDYITTLGNVDVYVGEFGAFEEVQLCNLIQTLNKTLEA